MAKKKGKKKMGDSITAENIENEVEIKPEYFETEEVFELLPEVAEDEEIKIKVAKPAKEKKPVMPPYPEIFIIKDLGNKKLVIKKDGTKIYIPK